MIKNFVRFGDLFDYENKSKIKAGDGLQKGKYPFYTSSNELSKYLDEYSFDNTSLIFGTGGNASIHYSDAPFSVSTDCVVAIPTDESIIYPKFVFYYLSGNINLLEEGFKGAGLKHISKVFINEIQIPLPPLTTQKRIAEILDAADALRRKDQELLKKYDELAKAIFIDMFGDPVKNEMGWDELICEEVFDMKLGKMLSAKNFKGTHLKKYLRNVNVKWGKIDFSNLNEMDFNNEECVSYNLIKDDILVCEGGEVGRTSVFEGYKEPIYFQNALHRLRVKNSKIMNVLYFEKFMEIAISKGLIRKEIISVTIQHFSLEKFRKLKIITPPINLQLEFAKSLANIKHQVDVVNSGDNISLFNSLIQKAFNGELVN
jgi:type I restriction enzyme S subunit